VITGFRKPNIDGGIPKNSSKPAKVVNYSSFLGKDCHDANEKHIKTFKMMHDGTGFEDTYCQSGAIARSMFEININAYHL
jgi:hypothetical protein